METIERDRMVGEPVDWRVPDDGLKGLSISDRTVTGLTKLLKESPGPVLTTLATSGLAAYIALQMDKSAPAFCPQCIVAVSLIAANVMIIWIMKRRGRN